MSDQPKYTQYAGWESRMKTYTKWPGGHSHRPENLVKAGFFYTDNGSGDRCKCFHCGGGLARWDPNDDPWIEHARWFPGCGYIRQYLGETFVDTVDELSIHGKMITRDLVEKYMRQKDDRRGETSTLKNKL